MLFSQRFGRILWTEYVINEEALMKIGTTRNCYSQLEDKLLIRIIRQLRFLGLIKRKVGLKNITLTGLFNVRESPIAGNIFNEFKWMAENG